MYINNRRKKFDFAYSLLDATLDTSSTPYGLAQSCDVHLGNYGITTTSTVKLIDLDLMYPHVFLRTLLEQKKCVSDWDCFVGRSDFCWSTCDKTKGTCKTLLGITINFPSFRSCVPFPFRNIILHLSFHLMQVLYDRLHKTFKSNRRWRFDSHWWRVLWWQVFVVAN